MKKKLPKATLKFEIVGTDEPLIARGGLVLPYEMARTLQLPQVIDRELSDYSLQYQADGETIMGKAGQLLS